MKKSDALEYINEHRTAVYRKPFKSLTPEQIKKHLKLISKNAPYGNDPWGK